MKIRHLLAALPTFAVSVLAGEAIVEESKSLVAPTVTPVPLTVLNLRSSYVFESDFERGDGASGDAWFNGAYVARRFPLGWSWGGQDDAGWFFRLGAEYGRFDFNNAGNLPLPETLQSANAVIAVEYLVRGEIAMLLETMPGFYFENDPGAESFDAPTRIAAAFALTPRLFGVAGVAYRGQMEKYPFLPALGIVWLINDQWRLRLVAPSPRLTYRPSEHWRFWVGGEFAGGAYRTDDDRSRQENLRNAALSYSEYKVGAGFTWGDPDRAALEVGAGYAFGRKFDYHRAEEGYETDEGAPYVRVSFSAGF